jgi:hypothetical protein
VVLQALASNKRAADGVTVPGAKKQKQAAEPSDRLFVGKMPLLVDAVQVRAALGAGVSLVHWLKDKQTGLFYGSAFVRMASVAEASKAVQRAAKGEVAVGKRKLRVGFAPLKANEVWPPAGYTELARPPVM